MSKRERILVIGLAVIGLLVGGQWGITSVRRGIEEKNEKITRLENSIEQRKQSIQLGDSNNLRMKRLSQASLPKNEFSAREHYQNWLNDLTKDVEIKPHLAIGSTALVTIKNSKPGAPPVPVFKKVNFNLKGQATIEQLTNLLYQFYDKNYLHRIVALSITRIPKASYQLDISLQGEVLILESAKLDQEEPTGSSMKLAKSKDEYIESIVGRNLFSPNNLPPAFAASLASVTGVRGKDITQAFVATDPEKDGVTYEFKDLPRGFRGSRTGVLTAFPSEAGKYESTVIAHDKGIPSRSTELHFKIQVNEPEIKPPPPPKLDIANFATISSLMTAPRTGVTVIIHSKLEAKYYSLKIGDELKLGELKAVLKGAGSNYAEFETDGKIWTAHQDESLSAAYQRKNPAVTDAAKN